MGGSTKKRPRPSSGPLPPFQTVANFSSCGCAGWCILDMLDMAVLAFRALMTRLKMLNAYLLDSVVTLLRMVAHCPIGWLGLIALFFLPLVQGADDGLSNGTDDMVRDVVALGAMALLSSKITAEWVLQGLNDR